MSFKLTAVAWNVGVDKSTDRLVLLALASKADDDGRNCYPSVDGICALTLMNRKTVFASIARLADRGLLSVRKRACTNSNEYVLHIDRWDENCSTENGSSQKRDNPKTERRSSQKRNDGSTENGTTVVPKTGHDSINTQSTTQSCTQSIDTPASGHSPDVTKKDEDPKPTRSALKKPEGVSDEVWAEWKAHKRKVSKNCTQRMVDALVREAGIAGIPPEKAMTIQLEKGWRGFEAKYLENTKPLNRNRFVEKKQSERNYSLDW